MAGFNEQVIEEFRANDGRTERWGDRLVVMHTIGAKSGELRLAPVMGLPDDGGWIVAASKGGSPENPAWYFNLVAHPDLDVEARIAGRIETVPVHARELSGEDRAAAWTKLTAVAAGFQTYQDRVDRVIPLFRLERR
jgi:deazaflavin-dependent oxidoreductase (nitroreductase family)